MENQRLLWANRIKMVGAQSFLNDASCQANYYYASLWANNKKVMKVLDVRKLIKRNCRALIFSGDHDMRVPHIGGTHDWIKSLNLTITDSNWDAWYSNGQVAGYKTTYTHNNYSLVFATVKGGGHTVPEYKPKT
ncbi:peptidase S10, serine carboxypeptidase, alpha/beta hydrolase fold protein [Tanacetum coccineum]